MKKQAFKEIFTFTKAERRGIFILLFVVFLLLIYDIFFPLNAEMFPNQSEFKLEVQKFLASQKKPVEDKFKFEPTTDSKPKRKFKTHIRPHPFDPNLMSYKQWIDMGLSPKQAKNIENYKRKGGRFKQPEDLRKIYSLSEDDFDILEPYIIIANTDDLELDEEFEEDINLPLNTIGIDEIQEVRGIGPSFAKRIIKYRDLLGGYTQIEQLLEVYGMDDERYHQIKDHFTINADSIHKISLNTASYYQLLRHPYLSKDMAYEISNYRKSHGKFKAVTELKKISLMNDSLYAKIYLYFAP